MAVVDGKVTGMAVILLSINFDMMHDATKQRAKCSGGQWPSRYLEISRKQLVRYGSITPSAPS